MSALADLAAECGILPEFRDLAGITRPTAPETQTALLRATGLEVDSEAMAREMLAERRASAQGRALKPEYVLPGGAPVSLPVGKADWRLRIEGGGDTVGHGDTLPPLPPGVHALTIARKGGEERTRLIAAPSACPAIEAVTGHPRLWGVTAALYGLHGAGGGGVGSFDDLGRAAEAMAGEGADFLGVNPVHALGWADHGTISPYSPSHRGFLDTRYVATGAGSGADSNAPIDYAAIGPEHRTRLEALYAQFDGSADVDAFRDAGSDPLATFALHEALSERHGPDWRAWPDALARRDPRALAEAQSELSDRIRFHGWLQWMANGQLATAQARATGAGMGLGLYLDLAVGPRRGGAESWCEAGAVARGVSLGAPPDHLGPDGQNWQLAAYAPEKLAALDYAPLRRVLAGAMRHAGMLRIDHVLGMNRSYWIPDDGAQGGYIRQPMDALLAIVAIEAARAGTVIIGEDLGLGPKGFRDALRARGLYGYSVLQYERDDAGTLRDPAILRTNSLLCFGTHDTPTLRGFWKERDIAWWQRLGWIDKAGAKAARKTRKTDRWTLGNGYAYTRAKSLIHRAMAASPAAMVAVQLDDILDHTEAQNLPGTVEQHPNWQRRYAVPVDALAETPALAIMGRAMRKGRAPKTGTKGKKT